MPHATARKPAARPARPAGTVPQKNMQRGHPSNPPSQTNPVGDLAIAAATAQALRAAPGVAEISPGIFALVATYGSGQRVAGVVVHHLAPEQIALETHVILSEAYCNEALADTDSSARHRGTEERGILADIASRIREAVYEGLRDITAPLLVRVDVFIDDLR